MGRPRKNPTNVLDAVLAEAEKIKKKAPSKRRTKVVEAEPEKKPRARKVPKTVPAKSRTRGGYTGSAPTKPVEVPTSAGASVTPKRKRRTKKEMEAFRAEQARIKAEKQAAKEAKEKAKEERKLAREQKKLAEANKLTDLERNLLEYPPTEGTWVCPNPECGTHNSRLWSKCWRDAVAKPENPRLLWPEYVAACAKVGVEPGSYWKQVDAFTARTKTKGVNGWTEVPLPKGI